MSAADAVREVPPGAAHWVSLLPPEDLNEFLAELIAVVRGGVAPEAQSTLLTQWRHTAEIYADPALLAALTREPEGDLGPVPYPDR
ncbi:hypothetical protein IU487_10560 [Nocardia puris]|uniref:Uncharacterized protein n=1 Tax=Nocardia puris TaxID=208602 RepID=A0A366DNQ5_9NOCA|nr:hypothetical protein [Nocardia puris]MBF6211487.1 hypothetical protein [Nocardia puris]RBO90848.1 hypothetical protein DFR74_105254 [Nocardia puris]